MLTPTLSAFPDSPSSKEAAGVPFGVIAQPLAPLTDDAGDAIAQNPFLEYADAVARCESCYGYINPYCAFVRQHHWRCSLCGTLNPVTPRYANAAPWEEFFTSAWREWHKEWHPRRDRLLK